MKAVKEAHREAMSRLDEATVAKRQGDDDEYRRLLGQAFESEKTSAMLCRDAIDMEPTRSVLFRSAASLALECKLFRDAEQLIALGLAGNPPDEIAEELRDLQETVQFERNMSSHEIKREPAEQSGSVE